MSNENPASRLPSSLADAYSEAMRPKPTVALILAARPRLEAALGARPSLFSAAEPEGVDARDLLARHIAEVTGEDGDAVVAALADDTNAAARALNKLLSGLAKPKGAHRGKVGRPSAAMDHFAAWVLGSTLKAQGVSPKDMPKRLAVALRRLGMHIGRDGASTAEAAYYKGRTRFGRKGPGRR